MPESMDIKTLKDCLRNHESIGIVYGAGVSAAQFRDTLYNDPRALIKERKHENYTELFKQCMKVDLVLFVGCSFNKNVVCINTLIQDIAKLDEGPQTIFCNVVDPPSNASHHFDYICIIDAQNLLEKPLSSGMAPTSNSNLDDLATFKSPGALEAEVESRIAYHWSVLGGHDVFEAFLHQELITSNLTNYPKERVGQRQRDSGVCLELKRGPSESVKKLLTSGKLVYEIDTIEVQEFKKTVSFEMSKTRFLLMIKSFFPVKHAIQMST